MTIAILLALGTDRFDAMPLDRMTDAEHAAHEAAANIPEEIRGGSKPPQC